MADTDIEWTRGDDGTPGKTWNPTRGCTITSPGCKHCYAMRTARRFSGPGGKYEGLTTLHKKLGPIWNGNIRLVPEMLGAPLRWKKPARIFVNSMSDLFHEGLTNEEIAAIFGVMAACPQHTFQVLTKRARRMREWFAWVASFERDGGPPPAEVCGIEAANRIDVHQLAPAWPLQNVWLGVSTEDQRRADERIPELLATPAAVRFLSIEPLLGAVDLTQRLTAAIFETEGLKASRIDWVIVGGESGNRARPADVVWIASIVDQCRDAGVACFVKQLGAKAFDSRREVLVDASTTSMRAITGNFLKLKHRKGGDPEEWDPDLRVRQFPEVRHA